MTECDSVKKITKQFLCAVSLPQFNFYDLLNNPTIETQQIIFNSTVDSEIVSKYPIDVNYQKTFVKYILNVLEKQETAIDDCVYNAYGRLVALPSNNYYFKHYMDNNGKIISLKENVSIISEGTTGLKTWQAALVFSEYALKYPERFHGNNILELGSGVGLAGLIITLNCHPKSFHFTDCHASVLSTLCENIKLNIPLSEENSICNFDELILNGVTKEGTVKVLNLPWEKIDKDICEKLGNIEKVVAADVIYDSDLFKPLINAIKCLGSCCNVQEFIFSCTERNKDTLDEFLDLLSKDSFKIEELDVPRYDNFIWCNDTPVRLFSFMKL